MATYSVTSSGDVVHHTNAVSAALAVQPPHASPTIATLTTARQTAAHQAAVKTQVDVKTAKAKPSAAQTQRTTVARGFAYPTAGAAAVNVKAAGVPSPTIVHTPFGYTTAPAAGVIGQKVAPVPTPIHSQPANGPAQIGAHPPGIIAPSGGAAISPATAYAPGVSQADLSQALSALQASENAQISALQSSLAGQLSTALAQLQGPQASPGGIVGAGGGAQQQPTNAGPGGGPSLFELGAAAAAVGILVFAARSKRRGGRK